MKKIMFSDKYGLTRAVLAGRKTMTRRVISPNFPTDGVELIGITDIGAEFRIGDNYEPVFVRLPYREGEEVAVAQSYNDIYEELKRTHGSSSYVTRQFFHKYIQGGRMPVSNKMFVRAEACFHRIRITDIKVERLQDISDEDCIKEGIRLYTTGIPQCKTQVVGSLEFIPPYGFDDYHHKQFRNFDTPREAFADLIDKVSGKGTWERNPWVFVYSFELVK